MQANADFAQLLLRLLQCGTWALQRPLSPPRQGKASGAAWRRLSAPLLCFLSTCRTSADNFLRYSLPSPRHAARPTAPLLFVSSLSFFFPPSCTRSASSRAAATPLQLLPLARAASHAAQTPELPRAAAFTRAWTAKRNVTIQVTENAASASSLLYGKLFQSVSDSLSAPARRLRTDQPPVFCPDILSEELVV